MKAFLIITFFILQSVHASPLLRPQLDSDEFYSETFSLFSDLGNGVYLYSQIGLTNIGPGDKKGLCHLLIVRPGHVPIHESVIVEQEEWSYNDTTESLKVAQCSLRLAENTRRMIFFGRIDKASIQIEFSRSPQKFLMPNSQVEQESGYYRPEIYIPWSTTTAKYVTENETSALMQGNGYADHSRTTLLPAQLASQWIRFRGIAGNEATLMLARFPPKAGDAEGWVWHRSGVAQPLLALKINRGVVTDEKSWSISFMDQTGKMEILSSQLLYRHAPLEEKGFLKKIVASIIGNPVTRTYRASLRKANGVSFSGILEVSFSNE